jgi:hypothetical protein
MRHDKRFLLALAASSSALLLAPPTRAAEDDLDAQVRANNLDHASEMVDFVRDTDGALILAHVDKDELFIRRSVDDGQTWMTLWTEVVPRVTELNSVSIDVANGFRGAPNPRMVHVAMQLTSLYSQQDAIVLYSGPSDRAWLPAEFGTSWTFYWIYGADTTYYNRFTVKPVDVDIAVVPIDRTRYSIVLAYGHVRFDGYYEVWMSENLRFGWPAFQRPIPLAGEKGVITRNAKRDFAGVSVAADRVNRRAIIGWGEKLERPGAELTIASYAVPSGSPGEIWRAPDLYNPTVAVNEVAEIYFVASSRPEGGLTNTATLFFDNAAISGGPMMPSNLGPLGGPSHNPEMSRRTDLEVRGANVRITSIEPVSNGSSSLDLILYSGVATATSNLTRERIDDTSNTVWTRETPKLSFADGEHTPIVFRDGGSVIWLDP